MINLNAHKTGLAAGSFLALSHLSWILLVALKIAKPLMDWVLSLHFIAIDYDISSFALGPAVLLVLLTFGIGYAGGWIFSALWNAFHS